MNKFANTYRSNLPKVHHARSKFGFADKKKGTLNLGELRVLDWRICVPGDSFKINEKKVIRTQPMVSAPMDDLVFDTFWFKMDLRDLWENFKKAAGESEGKWRDEDVEYVFPKLVAPETGFELGSIADDLGCTIGSASAGQKVLALPFRMYAAICNYWFRSTVTEDEIYIPTDDADQDYIPMADYDDVNSPSCGGVYTVNRNVDYLSLCSVEPQRGPAISINIGDLSDTAPVFGTGAGLPLTPNGTNFYAINPPNNRADECMLNTMTPGWDVGHNIGSRESIGGKVTGFPTEAQLKTAMGDDYDSSASGMEAHINIAGSTLVTINELRNAFAVQRYYELLSMYGNRYNEIIYGLFGVEMSDRSLHKPEFIGGRSIPIQIFSSVQSSETGETTPQGNVVGYSVTGDDSYICDFSTDDYSIVMCVGVARIKSHTYSQGLEKDLLIDSFLDLYQPELDSLGDVAVTNAEIYAQPGVTNEETGKLYDEEVFGYNERWYQYRTGRNHVVGMMRPGLGDKSLPWNFSDYYESMPYLSREWMKEDKALLDRVLAVDTTNADQFFYDYRAEFEAWRPMSAHSIPGSVVR